jgi:hypothetical protein
LKFWVNGRFYAVERVDVGDSLVTIWISEQTAPTRSQVQQLVNQALAQHGKRPWPSVEIDFFTAGQETLVLAHPGDVERQGFFFAGLEELLSGALPCPAGESFLYRTEGGYVLTVTPDHAGPSLYEFGQSLSVSALWELHAQEQGQCLLHGQAIENLHRYFSTGSNDCEMNKIVV